MVEKTTEDDQHQQASAGEKHKTEAETPDPKRTKVESETSADQGKENDKENDKREESNTHQTKNKEPEESKSEVKSENGTTGRAKADKGKDAPASILEKGIIYFFIRGRVDVDKPEEVDDIARSFIILRPIGHDAKLSKPPLADAGNTRILVLPKKVLPSSGRDRFLAFVDKTGASYDEIKGQFLAGADYETKTKGTRHTPAATPVGEGVYAITSTGRESHLAYMLTIPQELGEVQKDLGLKEQGSFIISTKNPEYPAPASARLPQAPEYPKKMHEEFHEYRWIPTRPHHLDYANTQILMIGESSGIKKALGVEDDGGKQANKEEPLEEMEELEEQDLKRMQQLSGDDSASIYADLKAHAEDYPKLQTTF
ncbi:uncharacterized protein TRIREDRAFT_81659 [Trichoderma reesei QM6a]|uniref:Predicted protein n=2 Tax=Hypocrea jecorina TaxID=51453 RepID=G0RUG2_HYPJQ|nr:uncharacterized protein TRIREDRAFT_81659 [Trichoderma reesei QM6a]EGR45190.1 predicted protein [Trichoderma reesei QM6a]ETR98322.1 hypothetical protein M419DRAFT_115071 [Trichoderma reesei RUT C-30]